MMTKDRVKKLAQEVGFDACGITLPKPLAEAEEALTKWTRAGKHGEMKYMEDFSLRREQFWARFANAKSVIVLGANYYSKSVCHSERSEESASADSSAPRVLPKGQSQWCSPCGTAFGLRMTGGQALKGRIARYAWGQDYHKVISKRLEQLRLRINEEAKTAVQFDSAVDTKPLFERSLAQGAGLGFVGKQTQLLSLGFGPWLFLSELVTDLALAPDVPFSGSCGTCRLCIDKCPTGAIEETGFIDARKCIAYLTIEHKSDIPADLRSRIGNRVFGCDECLNVCPYTAKQKETRWAELTAESGFGPELELASLFDIESNREYEEKFRDTAILRARRKQLLRNACVVLGNIGSRETLPTLERARNDSSLMVREHAEWAITRIENRSKSLMGNKLSFD